MSTATIETLTKMLESLPEPAQNQAIEHFRKYLEEITDELRWDESFARTSDKLVEFARQARKEIEQGKAEDMDLSRL
jgi:hypothetical protein